MALGCTINDMKTQNGYIVPVILVVLLLVLAGFFLFSGKYAESPTIESPVATSTPSATTSPVSTSTADLSDEEEGEPATTSSTTLNATITSEIEI